MGTNIVMANGTSAGFHWVFWKPCIGLSMPGYLGQLERTVLLLSAGWMGGSSMFVCLRAMSRDEVRGSTCKRQKN